MPAMLSEPKFTPDSYRLLDSMEKRLRSKVLQLLEDRMRAEGREVITDEDVLECFQAAFGELTSRAAPTK